jgi:hypothetical protein
LPEVDGPILLDTDVVSLIMKGYLDPAEGGLNAHRWCLSFTVGELAKRVRPWPTGTCGGGPSSPTGSATW